MQLWTERVKVLGRSLLLPERQIHRCGLMQMSWDLRWSALKSIQNFLDVVRTASHVVGPMNSSIEDYPLTPRCGAGQEPARYTPKDWC